MNCKKYLLILLGIFVFSFGYSIEKHITVDPPHAKVVVEPLESDAFILQIMLTNSETQQTNWGLGYFMLHVLARYKNLLQIKICNNNNECSDMQIIDNLQKFQGHINFIVPVINYILQPNQAYTITISGLPSIPRGVSMMPQQLFLYNLKTRHVTNIDVVSHLNTSYSESTVKAQYESYLNNNWLLANSTPVKSYILPVVAKVTYESGFNLGNQFAMVEYCNPPYIGLEANCNAILDQLEGYVLSIKSNQIIIYANTEAGIFYANQTLKQLQYYYPDSIPIQTIIDYPRFKYRGLMLDVVRHFISKDELERVIDVMAANKLNTLHLHLADDEGWRVEVKSYPTLTKIGSRRGKSNFIPASNLFDGRYDITNTSCKQYETIKDNYQGYYTVKDITTLIKYANSRQITVIPEIEMPGHALVLKKALNIVNENDNKYMSVQGYTNNVLPVCKYNLDQNFTNTLNNVIKNVANLFDNQTTVYAHNNQISLSGDEVPSGAYKGESDCNKYWRSGLTETDITHNFIKQIADNLPEYHLSGWQQLVQDDDGRIKESYVVNPNQTSYIWEWMPTNNKPISGLLMGNNLAKYNYKVVLDFADYSYFDIRYTPIFNEPGLYWATNYSDTYKVFELKKAINELYSDYLNHTNYKNNILGVEGAMWGELVPTSEHLWYMLLPKMVALSSVAWSSDNDLNWRNFTQVLGYNNYGFLGYLNKTYDVKYRGYPNGIANEVPRTVLDGVIK